MNRNFKKGHIKAAVALKYAEGVDKVPRVAAKGEGKLAEAILAIAKENDVPVREDPDLIELLYPLELEEEIPPKLYGVVAELLAYIYRINGKMKE